MTFKFRRASGLPILLEPQELHAMETLQAQGRWEELDDYEHELRSEDNLCTLLVEVGKIDELEYFIKSLYDTHPVKLNFDTKEALILDVGGEN